MSVVPKKPIDKVVFFENHNALWDANAVALGTTTTAVGDLTTKTVSARALYNAQQVAREAAKSATSAFKSGVQSMALAGSDIIKQIKTKAAITGGTSIYDLAQIPVPATPSPVGNPGTPSNLKVELTPDGTLMLSWKCVNPTGSVGTIYQINRKIGAGGAFVFVGSVGSRTFTDNTLPSGLTQVTYRIQAVRSTAAGMAQQFIVNFGVGGGMMITEEAPSRLAA